MLSFRANMPSDAPNVRRRSYVMHGAIAAGDMATVHFGRLLAPGGFARNVAIKRLHPHLAGDPDVAATFAEEARLSARVTHANVVAMLDVVSAKGELLLVMEYVHGESLGRLMATARNAGTPAPVAVVASILTDVLHGLHAAHEAVAEDGAPLRLVHRDVSPQNVIVGADGVARVVDFGIAKAIGRAQITREGQIKGKMPYMAPEQLLRRGIDRAVDVYAAGVVLWEALAGKRLFEADDEPALFGKVLEEPVVAPSTWNPEVPSALDAVTLKALSRDPSNRYATARDMALAIEEVVAHAPASAVAAWVASTAKEALEGRAAQVAELERRASAGAAAQVEAGALEVRAPAASVVFLDAAAPDAQVTDAPLPAIAAPPAHLRGVKGLIALAAVVSVVAAVVTLVRRPSPSPTAETMAAPVAPARGDVIAPAFVPLASAVEPPLAAASASASAPAPSPAAHRPLPAARWCKVFDANKRIFVMRSMRVTRCP